MNKAEKARRAKRSEALAGIQDIIRRMREDEGRTGEALSVLCNFQQNQISTYIGKP